MFGKLKSHIVKEKYFKVTVGGSRFKFQSEQNVTSFEKKNEKEKEIRIVKQKKIK